MKGMSDSTTGRDAKLGVLEHIQKFMQHLDDQALKAKLEGKEEDAVAGTDAEGVVTDGDVSDADDGAGKEESEPQGEAVAEAGAVEAQGEGDEGSDEPSDDEKLKALVKKRLGTK